MRKHLLRFRAARTPSQATMHVTNRHSEFGPSAAFVHSRTVARLHRLPLTVPVASVSGIDQAARDFDLNRPVA